ncbi:protein translocase subunit SecD [Ilumatobacteraceae bacterium]|nr:protein translocase subunit SecD [Ilumatobacteraceae bacterium]
MTTRRLWLSLIAFVVVVGGLLGLNLGTGNLPILGLDLQGGVSVILQPVEEASTDDLIVVQELIRDELESLGIAEPDVRVEGVNIVVDLPGVKDQAQALDAVDVAGIVTLRPVIACEFGLDPATLAMTMTEGQSALPTADGLQVCIVGPTGGTGEVFARGSANAAISQGTGQWIVSVDLRPESQSIWNALAAQCYSATAACPSQQLAIVLDDVVQSAPSVNQPSFTTGVEISGAFTEDEVRDLARVLNRGSFPVDVEAQRVETVSATAGSDSLRAAFIAGAIGVALMLLYLVAYYRSMAVVVVSGLSVWGALVFSLAALVSKATNFALSLAGITGIIVAIGVTVDSYLVLFERLKDEVGGGRRPRNAAPRSFKATWRTIVAADLVSVMAAGILFWLSVGSVKGFALYLGLTTLCDLVVCWFFTRPASILMSRRSAVASGKILGLEGAR